LEAGGPAALDEVFGAVLRVGLGVAFDGAGGEDVAGAGASVVAHAVDVEVEPGGRVGADEDGEGLAGPDAGVGAVALDGGAAPPVVVVLPGFDGLEVLEEPVAGAGLAVFH
jgi:hypothetical protein